MENVAMEDDQTTFAQLQDRIAKTIEALQAVKPESFVGKENSEVVIKAGPNEFKFNGVTYLQVRAVILSAKDPAKRCCAFAWLTFGNRNSECRTFSSISTLPTRS